MKAQKTVFSIVLLLLACFYLFAVINSDNSCSSTQNKSSELKENIERFLIKSTGRRIKELNESLNYKRIDTSLIDGLLYEINENAEKLKKVKHNYSKIPGLLKECEKIIRHTKSNSNYIETKEYERTRPKRKFDKTKKRKKYENEIEYLRNSIYVYSDTTLTRDLYFETGGLIIAADNITINGDFHIIKCTDENPPNDNYGIYMNGRTGVIIKNCGVNAFYNGIYLENSQNNTIYNNFIENEINAYEDENSNNNDWDYIQKGNSWSDYEGTGNYEITGQGDGIDNYPIYIECGDTIYESIILTQDLLNCPDDALIIGADNIILNGNNHLIEGDDRTDDGVYVFEKEGVTVKNCGIEEFRYAIYLVHGLDHTVKNNILNENKYGIRPINMSNSELIKNTITNNEYRGICAGDLSNNNIIKDNILIDNGDFGIHLINASYNTIQNNTINNSNIVSEYGIKITFTSLNNEVKNNFVNQNDKGIVVSLNCEDNEIKNNIITESDISGAYVDATPTDNNIFSNNLFMNNFFNVWEVTGSGTNYWSLDGIGNYWGDDYYNYTCIDNLEPFGICDNPYIFYYNQDDYPLAEPHFSPIYVTATINNEDTEVEIVWFVPGNEFRELEGYNVYRFLSINSIYDTLWVTIVENITDTIFTDTEWESLEDGIYQYAVKAVYTYGFLSGAGFSNEVIKGTGVEVKSNEINPLQTTLNNNYPNPFNPTTTIDFFIKEECFVQVEIFNIKGQKVRTLVNKEMKLGKHSLIWNGKDDVNNLVGSGVYFYNLVADGKKIEIKKCLLLK